VPTSVHCDEGRIDVEAVVRLTRALYESAPYPEVMDGVVLAELATSTATLRAMFEDPDVLNWWEQPSQAELRDQFEAELEELEARVANYETITAFRLGEIVEDPPTTPESWDDEYRGAVVAPVLYGRYERNIQVEDWQRVAYPDVGQPFRLVNQLCAWEFPIPIGPTMFLEAGFAGMYEGALALRDSDVLPAEVRGSFSDALERMGDAVEDAEDFIVTAGKILGVGLLLGAGIWLVHQYRKAKAA